MSEKLISEIKIESIVEILEPSIVERVKAVLKENYNCTFKISDKRNPYFNDLEVSKGEFIYRRILIGKDDVNFEIKLVSEIVEIIHQRPLMPSEVESINNKNFVRMWSVNDRKALSLNKKGYLFEIKLSVRFL
jgi:hypothetical protein